MGRGKQAAKQLKKQLGTSNPVTICQTFGYYVFKTKLPRRTKGFYTKLYGVVTIFINDQLPRSQLQYICAHELGHALMHEKVNAMHVDFEDNSEQTELEADEFAFWLLLDEKTEAHFLLGRVSVAQLSEVTHMPVDAIERLRQRKLI